MGVNRAWANSPLIQSLSKDMSGRAVAERGPLKWFDKLTMSGRGIRRQTVRSS